MAERTGCPFLLNLWSYVADNCLAKFIFQSGRGVEVTGKCAGLGKVERDSCQGRKRRGDGNTAENGS
jgi:hypothetical protein